MRTTRQAGVHEAKSQLVEMLRDVRIGHEFVITERGEPIARLVPIADDTSRDERHPRRDDAIFVERRRVARPPLAASSEIRR
jgi:prevent-host-death family protein